MTNSIVVDQQVAVVDVDGGPECGKILDFLTFQLFAWKIHVISLCLSWKFNKQEQIQN